MVDVNLGLGSSSSTSGLVIGGQALLANFLLDSAATCAVGQVLQYDSTAHNWIDFVSLAGVVASGVGVLICDETRTLAGDEKARCVYQGKVNRIKLDATALADLDIDACLAASQILALRDGVL